jgi:predicted nucleotidyltransferase
MMRNDKYFLDALDKIKNLLSTIALRGSVYLFGSSVKESYKSTSDIDIAVISDDKKKVILLKSEIEELNIPYKVDLIDLKEAGEKIREEILKDGVLIWKS